MTNAIIGAKGEMGKNLLFPLLKQIGQVITVDRDSTPKEWKNAWKADVIWLSIPREEVPKILYKVKLKSQQLIVDVCSIKRRIIDVIASTGATHLSLHPLHGPYIALNGQKWALIKTGAEHNKFAKQILDFLRGQGIQILEPVSENEHDFMMGVVLSFPEILTIVIDEVIDKYAKINKVAKPSMEKIMEWAVPASNALFSFYIRSIDSSANWLRNEIINESYGNLIESTREALQNLGKNLDSDFISKSLTKQRERIDKLSKQERARVKQLIERWFSDATQKIFSFHKQKDLKPNLVIQKMASVDKVFPKIKKKIRVGIHGIEGSFSHESLLRLCEELGVMKNKIVPVYLVEAERVVASVKSGEVDRGIIAVANSGSGAYISSFEVMSKNQFDILGIYGMEIMQCLIANNKIEDMSGVKEVFGHPQAVSQCKRTFAEKYPEIKLVAGKDSDDTALCVKKIADGELPKTTATLASQLAAKKYGLKILEYGMHHDPFNTTTFLIIKKSSIVL
ncbi:MAG: Chorismate mutase/prephenate dehydratase (PheA) [Candidatus Nomurabacteria bacterium GW2011_GWF2_40_31]|uniref:prephenate dehydratase n=2 Tax=Candidatus Nomuraibacteriota TaxID=1752729 RepID=A0A837HQZ8_9BACT|nr:MAG: Chorismate mutase/prephenate dehydratase (PheA) [Candidatus Nomurabacteria bacterium GW2011_GWD2_39_12]KKR20307.1 MAG: Chorismate mutase/prephenate dehydratase (PheA) [Candidatus Nomurabacteria bacterium GW2011_GWC2_39_41]KKR36255.1 MAG: Chorismate mutase/prephenate dehydratase (PheA) [Candidatus Nomurabacteria bacterium GW2011_GWE2_40_10]KKR38401.1 MAG: Chorismate mutase/prephenate dehydratase (PheA) [Candidatus Nomurabacteria bacterium GW2011_GWB1_40_11]KKR39488.1 MAG: Chorismate muta